MSYIGKIRIEDAQALAQSKAQGDVLPDAYSLGAEFNAVRIGESPTFYYYHVNHPVEHASFLPGEFVSNGYEDLPAQASPFILEATYEEETEEGTITHRVKERDVPDGTPTLESGLIPHRFA